MVSTPPARDDASSKLESPPREFWLAVDTGGTKTAAWLVDATTPDSPQVLGRARTSAGNPLSVGFERATETISEALAITRTEAGLPSQRLSRAILSIAGAANREMTARFIDWARTIGLADEVAIVSDVLPILAAGTLNCRGIALISGTGSVAFGRAADGQIKRCGGWGYLLGDEGSGYAIGRAALQLALRTLEARTAREPLAEIILNSRGANTVTELTRSVYGQPDVRHAIAALAPLVTTAADNGDADARAILDDAAHDLAKLAARAVHCVGLCDEKFPLAVSGGVLVSSHRLQEQVKAGLGALHLKCEMKVVQEPLEGCVRLADPQYAEGLVTWHAT